MAVYCIAEARMEGSKWVYYWKEEFDMEEVEMETMGGTILRKGYESNRRKS